jgi:uncharacterized protein (DUF433 family)
LLARLPSGLIATGRPSLHYFRGNGGLQTQLLLKSMTFMYACWYKDNQRRIAAKEKAMTVRRLDTDDDRADSDLIRKTPNVLGGDARIGDRRIAVWMLVRDRQLGLSDAEIKKEYLPPLTNAELAAAWKYAEQNREEIDRAIRDNEED